MPVKGRVLCRCSGCGFQQSTANHKSTFHQKTTSLSPTLSATAITNCASSCSRPDFVCNRTKVTDVLQAHTSHLLPFSYDSSSYRIQQGCKKIHSLLFHSRHSNSTETPLKCSQGHSITITVSEVCSALSQKHQDYQNLREKKILSLAILVEI